MILIHPNRLSTYLDEIHDEPGVAVGLNQTSYGLKTICLRRAWTGNIANNISEAALTRLKHALGQLKVLLLSSDLGYMTTSSNSSSLTDTDFEKPFLVANFFGASFIRIHIGTHMARHIRPSWMKRVGDRAIKANITPVFEYNPEYGKMYADDILELINIHPRWKILYDPSQFITRRNLDPFEHYWKPLRDKIALIELRDYKIGEGFKPVGHGDCNLKQTLEDANTSGFKGQYIIETGLGNKYGTALSRKEVFALAYNQVIEHL